MGRFRYLGAGQCGFLKCKKPFCQGVQLAPCRIELLPLCCHGGRQFLDGLGLVSKLLFQPDNALRVVGLVSRKAVCCHLFTQILSTIATSAVPWSRRIRGKAVLQGYGNSISMRKPPLSLSLLLPWRKWPLVMLLMAIAALAPLRPVHADMLRPWKKPDYALVLDAYELNALDWERIVGDKRIAGFIGKASDGLPQQYCADRESLCGAQWRKYSVSRELYHTRRTLAKALGLKWGSYHLGRAGNPELQALHYVQYARPQSDEVVVLDIENYDDSKFMSLEEAERFVEALYARIDRYPMLYTNHRTARHIAENRAQYPLLSRLKLWYARYKEDIGDVFPMGNWDSYTLWQFAYGGNCNRKACPYRIDGAPNNIDVNVVPFGVEALRAAWPFDGLHEEKPIVAGTGSALAENAVEDPEAEKHSDFVTDPDYNPGEAPPGAVVTSPAAQAPAKTDNLTTASPGSAAESEDRCGDRQREVESDDLAKPC